jgi:hypothetical protein
VIGQAALRRALSRSSWRARRGLESGGEIQAAEVSGLELTSKQIRWGRPHAMRVVVGRQMVESPLFRNTDQFGLVGES